MMASRSNKAETRRADIFDAALALFAVQGFSATSTRQIAAAADVAEGLLFHYFPSKVAIMHALADRRHTLAFSILRPTPVCPTHPLILSPCRRRARSCPSSLTRRWP
jgi:AcrR family transcriptional regulator